MTSSNLQPELGGVSDMGRLIPAAYWAPDPGVVQNGGVVDQPNFLFNSGIGNQIIIFPWWTLLDLTVPAVASEIKNFELYIRYYFNTTTEPYSPYLQGRRIETFGFRTTMPEFAPADVQPGSNPRVGQASLQTMSWEGWKLPDLRTDEWPPSEASLTVTPDTVFPPIITTSLGEQAELVVVVNSVGGVDQVPSSREGECFRAMVAVGGLARAF